MSVFVIYDNLITLLLIYTRQYTQELDIMFQPIPLAVPTPKEKDPWDNYGIKGEGGGILRITADQQYDNLFSGLQFGTTSPLLSCFQLRPHCISILTVVVKITRSEK